jgi:endonuclease YncB( thermonuclease family)
MTMGVAPRHDDHWPLAGSIANQVGSLSDPTWLVSWARSVLASPSFPLAGWPADPILSWVDGDTLVVTEAGLTGVHPPASPVPSAREGAPTRGVKPPD